MQGLWGGIVITLFNLVGALLVVVWRNPSQRSLDVALGFAAGIMLTASFTSLILPGIEVGGLWPAVLGMVLGGLVLDRTDVWVPHVHVLFTWRRRADAAAGGAGEARMAGVILFIVAITLHNMPEGLAVGVAFGGGSGVMKHGIEPTPTQPTRSECQYCSHTVATCMTRNGSQRPPTTDTTVLVDLYGLP